jgi:hypothetical protein
MCSILVPLDLALTGLTDRKKEEEEEEKEDYNSYGYASVSTSYMHALGALACPGQ